MCVCDCLDEISHRRFLVNRLDDEFLIIERNVSDFTPGEANLRGQSEGESTRK